jgi:hypothetical protein
MEGTRTGLSPSEQKVREPEVEVKQRESAKETASE